MAAKRGGTAAAARGAAAIDATAWLELLLVDADPGEFDRVRRELLTAASDGSQQDAVEAAAGLAIRLHGVLREHRQRLSELSALHELTVRLSGVRNLDALLQDIVTEARRLLAVDVAYLALPEADGSLPIKVTDGSLGPHLRGVVIPPHTGLAGRVMDTGEPMSSTDYLGDEEIRHEAQVDKIAVTEGLRTISGVPLRLRGEVIGVLMVAEREIRPISQNEMSLLASLASFAAIAIESATLFDEQRLAAQETETANDALRRQAEGVTRAATLHERLMDIALSGGGVTRVIEALSELIDGVVIYLDEDDRPVAAASNGRAVADVQPPLIDGAAPSTVLRPLAQRHTMTNDGVVTVPVASADAYFGALQVTNGDQPVSLDDAGLRLLERSALTIALVVASDKAVSDAERRSSADLLEQLLTRRIDDPTGFARRARGLGLDLATRYAVVCIDPKAKGDAIALAALEGLVRDTGGLAARLAGQVVGVVRTDQLDAVRDQVAILLPHCTIGLAGPATGPTGLAAAYADAAACVAVLRALGREPSCAAPDDLGPYRFLLSRAGRYDVERFIASTVGPLVEHDRTRGTDLVATADAYLAGGRQHAATATALTIHPNTLYQRLQRIAVLLGDDWRDGDRALDVQLALRLHRLTAEVTS